MGVAYPLASRFRTGMTIAMFALIIFSLTVMSVLNASFLRLFAGEEATGGWDIAVSLNRNNPIGDLLEALRQEGSYDVNQITATGALTPLVSGSPQEVRQTGREGWSKYPVRGGDDAFFAQSQTKLEGRARGYASDRAVFEAVRSNPGLAIIDSFPMQNQAFSGSEFDWQVQEVKIRNGAFEPFTVEFSDPTSGKSAQVTVIGVLSARIPSNLVFGLFTNAQAFAAVYGPPEFRDLVLRLVPGMDSERSAKDIKAALVTQGVQAASIQKQIDDTMAQSRGFLRIFQAFMGLGLVVGIMALGVIAFRSVVERRQQIGMLRAIGYQQGTVALSFLIESSFIASMGILSGVVGAVILSWNLVNSSYFAATSDLTFFIPWSEVIGFLVIAYVFALLMTWWPSRRAARVPVADALRYE
jgi:putative ABC transport system permease protein